MPLQSDSEHEQVNLDLIFAGVGGQGVIVLSDIFCEAALLDGFDVAKAEIRGMAQRGGSIIAHVRIGEKVESPLIERGKADIIVGFEALETARALPMLNVSGTVILNLKYIPPTTVLDGSAKPLTLKQLICIVKEKATKVHEINGFGIAEKLGNLMVVNTVLLGSLSAIPENPVRTEAIKQAIADRLKQKYLDVNLKAFQLGREQVTLR
jgi:indolepyruvate ferredoxin oxidoreductase beta subunit